ncbi:biotin--[acetyl-CoA-carboxylase] ligase [Dyadobacter arcticus]|uniref:BirA family biotin operon repressor/biotin-[acetyl-CoA-carboxylase] ligase n=1 Tax=Dyadobacter arcticus TaxID=1078754 RepID=A0ABX0UG78_9BACT|nr:biotin--[acetyl-CoA-carboxylase] ligase [Dyadobacter arcticus]NIJ52009.1 BirA family biotin operon repressor/biotin-[acetyl-CoA-carboxylase] ligase [Dyadobacter arcticus]
MYNSIQDTLIIGKKVIYLPSCHSTNDIAAEIVHAGLFTEGTVVITDNQLKGRGQRGTTWVANPGENLTFSIILTPEFLPVSDQFLISQITALAIRSYVHNYIENVRVKWPNDILANKKKICGILIENGIQGMKLKSSVIGIGLNVNQLDFKEDRATSLSLETGVPFALPDEFQKLLGFLDKYYVRLRQKSFNQAIRAEYLSQLHGYGKELEFIYENKARRGTIAYVSSEGLLGLNLSDQDEVLELGLKQIQWLIN